METLQLIWYIVFITAIFAYAALDGFDLGVGCLHLFTRSDYDRRIFMNAIGPVWDSNSLWVVITAGVLLSGFPPAFSTLLSSLYIPMMLIIFCFTYRAVAIEFRSKITSPKWRSFWDIVFSVASFGMAFGLGMITANLIEGLPIDKEGNFVKGLSVLFSPYSIALGIFAVLLFMMHGSLYLTLKTTGALHERLKRWNFRILAIFAIMWTVVNVATPIYEPHVTQFMQAKPAFYVIAFMSLAGLISVYSCIKRNMDGWAFACSSIVILSLVLLYALGTYPNLVRSSLDDAYSLTIYNSSSTAFTLKILIGMACAGVPLFLLYISYAYKVFMGKVELDTMSY
ncbi:MAG: cytochrome d ubiquinol oxidase subunit II [Verrucomicrobia bacterium]|nr:cytochrome d ubiquinol oxidase subunit II [Verrucomicrobiota bacterium]MBS0636597.1 cytochrome d ubiquinol oxidase subunit II [Verrucomicrobiota bacterium]